MSAKTWQKVLIYLRQIIRATDLHSKKVMRDFGLTVPQLVVLRAIRDMSNVTVRAISDRVSLSQATVTIIINWLDARGLVVRRRSSDDRRVVHTELTEAGCAVVASSPSLLQEDFVSRFEALEEWEQTSILAALQRVARMMDAESIDAAPLLDIVAADKLE